MFAAFWSFFLGSPIKLALWAGNRLATWTGLFVVWKRLKGAPNRLRTFLLAGAVINLLSLGVLAGVLWMVARRAR